MGEHDVSENRAEALRKFTKALLDDIRALEKMIDDGQIESGVRRIGAEQEMFLIGRDMNVAPKSVQVLETASDDRLTTELAQFNLEANLSPREFGGTCLREMEAEIVETVNIARAAAREHDADVLLTGILPTLRKSDLGLDNLTPAPRYRELNRCIRELRGGDFHIMIKGVDEFETTHDNVMLESCNTSFQIHFQVAAEEFAPLYNLAQFVTAPVLAAAVNSPVLFQKRLWAETRVALFERSIDTRRDKRMERPSSARVHFGEGWLDTSVLEVFKRDVSRFRVMLSRELDEDPLVVLRRGGIPELNALRLHNGTVWRWNRACYGIGGGVPHLRIENRVLPAGPTVVDEVANAAFFFGLMIALGDRFAKIDEVMPFDDVKSNFFAAGRHGLQAQFSWLGERTVTAQELIVSELLPAARDGLITRGIDLEDVDRYLGILQERVTSGKTGTRWFMGSLAAMDRSATVDVRYRTLTKSMLEHSHAGHPVHQWPRAVIDDKARPLKASLETVSQLMSTDLFTVRPGDIIDLAAALMDWERVRHVPVEDDDGRLVGLLSHRQLLRQLTQRSQEADGEAERPRVEELMTRDPVTAKPDTPTLQAIRTMRERKVSCLPVVRDGKLVGLLSERDLINVTARLLEEFLENTD